MAFVFVLFLLPLCDILDSGIIINDFFLMYDRTSYHNWVLELQLHKTIGRTFLQCQICVGIALLIIFLLAEINNNFVVLDGTQVLEA